MTRFVHFGCWNNLNEKNGQKLGNLHKVMKRLNSYIVAEETGKKPAFLVLAGDNYYPGKTKMNNKKKKVIYTAKLVEGFSILPQGIQINMILGNHDLETNGTNDSLFINNNDQPERLLYSQQ